ncbi:KTSC domain-containing protein [Polynucleobacter sp.]|uniref:KTSC domain-containing protein n=1 Tax=Polynucleobacter sp. TaxID=2029855 RepID=UPI003340B94F
MQKNFCFSLVVSKYVWDSDLFLLTIHFRNKTVIQFFNFPHDIADQFARSPFKAVFIKRLKKNHTYPYNKIAKPAAY